MEFHSENKGTAKVTRERFVKSIKTIVKKFEMESPSISYDEKVLRLKQAGQVFEEIELFRKIEGGSNENRIKSRNQ